MTIKQDIQERITADFKESAIIANEILIAALSKTEYLRTDRIIRCIIYLSDGDLSKLRKYIDTAIYDPRDVMLWAEYDKMGIDENPIQIRNFNRTFDDCEIEK
jgi:hypothetical protein